jgi:hypothetical protein
MNFVAVQSRDTSEKVPAGFWFEAIAPQRIEPQDIHAAQLARRLSGKSP